MKNLHNLLNAINISNNKKNKVAKKVQDKKKFIVKYKIKKPLLKSKPKPLKLSNLDTEKNKIPPKVKKFECKTNFDNYMITNHNIPYVRAVTILKNPQEKKFIWTNTSRPKKIQFINAKIWPKVLNLYCLLKSFFYGAYAQLKDKFWTPNKKMLSLAIQAPSDKINYAAYYSATRLKEIKKIIETEQDTTPEYIGQLEGKISVLKQMYDIIQTDKEDAIRDNIQKSIKNIGLATRSTIMSVKNLKKTYDGKRYVLKNISFEIFEGDIVGILGLNGAGKTTLLKCILKMTNYQGSIKFMGVEKYSPSYFGVLWAENGIPIHDSVIDSLKFYAAIHDTVNNAEEIYRELDTYGIAKTHKEYRAAYSTYSAGMKRKTAIVRSYMLPTSFFVIDEPTSNLDIMAKRDYRKRAIAAVKTSKGAMLIVTHEYDELVECANKLMILQNGRVLALETVETIKNNWLRGSIFKGQIPGEDKQLLAKLYRYAQRLGWEVKIVNSYKGTKDTGVYIRLRKNIEKSYDFYKKFSNAYLAGSLTYHKMSFKVLINNILQGVAFI